MKAADARKRLKKLLASKTDSWDLAEASLLIAAETDPELEPRTYLARLDQWAGKLKDGFRENTGLEERLESLARFLGTEQGLTGNPDDYYNPESSLINKVLEKKTGIPLSLSILYLAVAARLGLPLAGIPLPGHFLVATRDLSLIYDPADRGKRLQKPDLQAIVDKLFGPGTVLNDALLQPVDNRVILARLVRNLKNIFISRQDLSRLLWCTDLGLILEPREPELLKERGLVRYQLGQYGAALSDIQAYLHKVPRKKEEAAEDDAGRLHVELLYRVLSAMN